MVLENIHLAGEWIHDLEAIVEQLPMLHAHPEFRLWMTMVAGPEIPPGLLQASVKLMDAAPVGYPASLRRSLLELPTDLLTDPELGAKKVGHLTPAPPAPAIPFPFRFIPRQPPVPPIAFASLRPLCAHPTEIAMGRRHQQHASACFTGRTCSSRHVPRGLQASTVPSLQEQGDADWRRVIMALCHFHAVLLERQSYTDLCWNLPINFTGDDLASSIAFVLEKYQLDEKLRQEAAQDAKPSVPIADTLAAVSFTVGQCIYGGRVADSWDRRLLQVTPTHTWAPPPLHTLVSRPVSVPP